MNLIETHQQIAAILTGLVEAEETLNRIRLIVSGDINELQKTCSNIHNSLLEDNEKIVERLDKENQNGS